ncbi:NAD(P)/FAD-dependent oxidoreductase, partial [Oceanobacter sp. 2_MG-2023]|nr:NAD(P)/FAD-dependent oxidoreductase [Oceanobacter sp. 2_MG-2023]
GFWRDLVAFTWNIKTREGREAIEAMLSDTLAQVQPSNWRLEEEATVNNGVIEAWICFDSAVAHGRGHLRLRQGQALSLIKTMVE